MWVYSEKMLFSQTFSCSVSSDEMINFISSYCKLLSSACMHAKSLQEYPTPSNPMGCSSQAPPLSMRFSRQKYQSGLPCPPAGDLPQTGIELMSPALQVDSLSAEPPESPSQEWLIHKWGYSIIAQNGLISYGYCRDITFTHGV